MASKPKALIEEPTTRPRDYWPTMPTREDCVAAGFPTDYANFALLQGTWSALNVEEKEALGFTQEHRRGQIERLISEIAEKRK